MNLDATLTDLISNYERRIAELQTNLTPNGICTCGMDSLAATYIAPRIRQTLSLLRNPERIATEYNILEQWVKDAASRIRKNSGRLPNDPNERLATMVRQHANTQEHTVAAALLASYTQWLNAQPAATV